MSKSRLPVLIALGLCGISPAAEEPGKETLPGHSMHGEAFDEGPRQFATLMPGMGDIRFAVTTRSPDAQKFFNQGVAQLHGFWYLEAERSFRQVAWLDRDCAMAYWGMSMANINNPKRAGQLIKEATRRRDKASPREQRWIDAWTEYYNEKGGDEKVRRGKLIGALEDLVFLFPDELEARAFLVFQLWDNQQHGVPLPSRLAVDALAQQVIAKAPAHPGIHHYLIHLWNHKDGDKRAVANAANCGQAAPGIAHLWHMSGHTFSELRRYSDAAWQQEASARVDHAYMNAARVMPEQIHNYAHNNDWLVQDLVYVGRIHDAIDLAKNLIELPRLAPGKQQAWRMGRDRLLDTMVSFEQWKDITALDSTMYFTPDDDPAREIVRLRTLGVAYFSIGDVARGQEKLDQLKQMLENRRAERITAADKAATEAEKANKPEDEVSKAMADAMRRFAGQIKELEKACAEVRAYRALSNGDADETRKQLDLAKMGSSPRMARIHQRLGGFDKAIELARDKVKSDEGQVFARAILAGALWQKGERDEAIKAFNSLRERSAQLDLDVPVFAELAPIAAELKLPSDWRTSPSASPDSGTRPNLAELGPFRWHPYPAPGFTLKTESNESISLGDYRGKPVLVVFYLGAGCSHCIEQLNALSPVTKGFADAGIEVVAISTETPDGLKKTLEKGKDGKGFPFRIVSDHELTAFHAFRSFDDFETMPLHGTFLIDANGLVRWQNISYQPFKDMNWLLGESKRLLGIPTQLPAPATVSRSL
jgi:peroxiredoxin/tetratricopeptide (TPR) repeat protein